MRFLRFILSGAINTATTYALYLALLPALGYLVAYSAAYAVGIGFSYWLNSTLVFRQRMSLAGFLKFPLVYVAQYAITAFVLWICVDIGGISREISLLPAIVIAVPFTYLSVKFLIEGPSRPDAALVRAEPAVCKFRRWRKAEKPTERNSTTNL